MGKHKLDRFSQWKQHTVAGLATFTLVEALLTYGFASWSIDSGSLLLYLVTALFFIGTVKNFIFLIKALIHGQSKTGKTRHTKS